MKIGKELKPYWILGRKGETIVEGYSLEIPWLQGEFAVTQRLEGNNCWTVTELTTGTALHDVTGTTPRKTANKLKNHYGPEHPCWGTFEEIRQKFINVYGERDRI
jgi:hypothetical protein